MLGAYALDGDAVDVPLPGGCPIQNAAIEGDHADDGLRAIALAAMSDWRGWIERLVAGGIASGELRPNVDPVEVSAVVVGGLEGGVMLAHLYRSPEPLAAAVRRLRAFVDALEAP
ncbi:MAG: TetR family transcriptional regulator C-terminal domain-containing protein, partial [Myxococcota bacterium]